jgi:Cytochrome c554 and c-prime
LFNDQSKQIATRLHLSKPAYEEARCLACHAETTGGGGLTQVTSVGCESCHGPAWLWLDPHTAGAGWRDKFPDAAKTLLDVNDLPAVARSCVGCHIGAPAKGGLGVRDMNHDMIAAGHPRLNFEFAGYFAQLPAHWNEKARPRDAGFYARAWAVGQVVSAEAALDLLEYRARQPAWPELAEFACYACHHDLAGPGGWRKDSKGTLQWGSWYFAALKSLAPEISDPIHSFAEGITQRQAGPKIVEAAKSLRPLLAGVVNQVNRPLDAAALRMRVASDLKEPANRDWDGAAQLYLALAALSPDVERAKLAPLSDLLRRPADFRRTTDFDSKFRALIEHP